MPKNINNEFTNIPWSKIYLNSQSQKHLIKMANTVLTQNQAPNITQITHILKELELIKSLNAINNLDFQIINACQNALNQQSYHTNTINLINLRKTFNIKINMIFQNLFQILPKKFDYIIGRPSVLGQDFTAQQKTYLLKSAFYQTYFQLKKNDNHQLILQVIPIRTTDFKVLIKALQKQSNNQFTNFNIIYQYPYKRNKKIIYQMLKNKKQNPVQNVDYYDGFLYRIIALHHYKKIMTHRLLKWYQNHQIKTMDDELIQILRNEHVITLTQYQKLKSK